MSISTPGAGVSIPFGATPFHGVSLYSGISEEYLFGNASTNLNFATGSYYDSGRTSIGSIITTSRASSGYIDDTSGNWTLVNSNLPRRSNKGLLVEEQRTNLVPNNSTNGASVGTPGTLPTGWTADQTKGMAVNVIAFGTTNGVMDYIDLRIVGVPNVTNVALDIISFNTAAVRIGFAYSWSGWTAIVGGSNTNLSQLIAILAGSGGVQYSINTSSTLVRNNAAGWNNATIIPSVTPGIRIGVTNGQAVDITIRVAWPQVEECNTAATVASAAVASGGTGYVNGNTITLAGGTGTAAVLTVTNAVAGVIQAGGVSVTNAGSYSTFPTSPASQASTSGAGTGATFTLTNTDFSGSAFPSSPIRTTSAAATRAADVVTLSNLPSFGSAYTFLAQGMPEAPLSYATNQVLLTSTVATGNDRLQLIRTGSTGTSGVTMRVANANQYLQTGASWPQNSSRKIACAIAAGDQQGVFNGTLMTSGNFASIPATPTEVDIGALLGQAFFNGYIAQIAIWPTIRLPNATLQALTT